MSKQICHTYQFPLLGIIRWPFSVESTINIFPKGFKLPSPLGNPVTWQIQGKKVILLMSEPSALFELVLRLCPSCLWHCSNGVLKPLCHTDGWFVCLNIPNKICVLVLIVDTLYVYSLVCTCFFSPLIMSSFFTFYSSLTFSFFPSSFFPSRKWQVTGSSKKVIILPSILLDASLIYTTQAPNKFPLIAIGVPMLNEEMLEVNYIYDTLHL